MISYAGMVIQIRKQDLKCEVPVRDLKRLQSQFEQQYSLLVPQFLEASTLKDLREKIKRAVFYDREHKDIALESCMRPNIASEFLNFASNDPRLHYLLAKITGCGRIGCFIGRVYRLIPDSRYYDTWHGDLVKGRLIAMSIDLSEGRYRGGILQIKDKRSGKIVSEIQHEKPGDAIFFRIAPYLRHRVMPLKGKIPRTVYAGWFRSGPHFLDILKRKETVSAVSH